MDIHSTTNPNFETYPNFNGASGNSHDMLRVGATNDLESLQTKLHQVTETDPLKIAQNNNVKTEVKALPKIRWQYVLSCEAMALINAMICYKGEATMANVSAQEIRKQAVINGGHKSCMADIADVLIKQGKLKGIKLSDHDLITISRELFQQGRFIGINKWFNTHAVSIVPLPNPTEKRFALELDSLFGRKIELSYQKFKARIKKSAKHEIYEVL